MTDFSLFFVSVLIFFFNVTACPVSGPRRRSKGLLNGQLHKGGAVTVTVTITDNASANNVSCQSGLALDAAARQTRHQSLPAIPPPQCHQQEAREGALSDKLSGTRLSGTAIDPPLPTIHPPPPLVSINCRLPRHLTVTENVCSSNVPCQLRHAPSRKRDQSPSVIHPQQRHKRDA